MSDDVRTCDTCGGDIIFRWMGFGPVPIHLSGGCSSGSSGYTTARPAPGRAWTIAERTSPLTYRTRCWWCKEPVFFHTNGFGDCVLFDDLGWPWPIHSCWEEHVAAERTPAIAKVQADLDAIGFDGRFYRPREQTVEPGRPGQQVTVDGYVADNHALYDQPRAVRLSASQQSSTAPLTPVDIVDGTGRLLPFLLPETIARGVPDYSLLRLRGLWLLHGGQPYLIATSLHRRSFRPGSTGEIATWRWRRSLRTCHYCGRRLSPARSWGFDPNAHPECSECATARGALTPRQFLARCRRIAKRHERQ